MIDQLCKDCGDPFSISLEQKANFEKYKMALPKLCKPCRNLTRILIGIKKIKIALKINESKLQTQQGKGTPSPTQTPA